MYKRELDITKYELSFFLFGPRQVGKTFLIEHTIQPDLYINLLRHDEFLKYSTDVSRLSQEIDALKIEKGKIVVDEIQRCPELLNEVQLNMGKNKGLQFILTGSSARKLKRSGVNLLGGRAITLHLFPLTFRELGEDFSLGTALKFGSLPNISLEKSEENKKRLLKSYVETYLREEIQQESLVRNIPAFAKFLELAAFESGNVINFHGLSREIGVHSKTIKEYFQILEDTLLGYFIYPYKRSDRKRIISHPKFYFFDRGVTTMLRGETDSSLTAGTPPYGPAFEHFIVLELIRISSYLEKEIKFYFFRTSDGAEVDLILEFDKKIWAVEIKAGASPSLTDIRGLRSFMSDHVYHRAICACQANRPYSAAGIDFLPWQEFFRQFKEV
jgi:predicted AAA+ superfamily ATPase